MYLTSNRQPEPKRLTGRAEIENKKIGGDWQIAQYLKKAVKS